MSMLQARSRTLRPWSGDTVRIFPCIADVDHEEWDSILSGDDQQVTHRFVRTCQESGIEDASYRHVLVEQRGRLAAVATLSATTIQLDLLMQSRLMRNGVQHARRIHPTLLRMPIVFCGLPVSFGRSCIRIAPHADAAAAVTAVMRAAEDFARSTGAGLICFKEHTPEEESVLDVLQRSGYARVPSLPACTLHCRWSSFDEYVTAMRSGYRRQLLADVRAGAASGLHARVLTDFHEQCEAVYRLYAEVMHRAKHRLEHLTPAFFRQLNTRLAGEVRVVLLERGTQLLGVAVLLERPGTMTFLLAGLDYRWNRQCHTYFNVIIEVIREAFRRGARTIELGQTSYRTKTRWGGELSPLWLYVRHRNGMADKLLRSASGVLFPTTRLAPRHVFHGGSVTDVTGRAGSRTADLDGSATLP